MTDNFVIQPGDTVSVTVVESEPLDMLLISGLPGGADSTYYGVLPLGQQDGVRASFPLPQPASSPGRILVFRNGLLEVNGVGFTATATQITFSTPPLDTDVITLFYTVN